MDQSLAVMSWKLCYSKISFIVLVPGCAVADMVDSVIGDVESSGVGVVVVVISVTISGLRITAGAFPF